MAKKYHGIIPPIITPVDERENVDEEAFCALLERCVRGGLHGIFVAGTNGECMQLTQRERERAIRIALRQVNGRVPVVCGVMDCSTRRVIDNVKALEQMGGACAAVTPIFYARHTSQDESLRHYEKIAHATQLDIVIYNIPSMTGLALAPATVIRLVEADNIVAYKDSSPNYGGFMQVLAACKDTPFSCLQGVTPQAVSALLMGADGFVPALAPLFPQMFRDAYEAGVSGDARRAWRYNELIRESSKILTLSKNMTAAAKYAISTTGLTHKRVIWPQDGTTPEEEARIDAQIARVNELYVKEKASENRA